MTKDYKWYVDRHEACKTLEMTVIELDSATVETYPWECVEQMKYQYTSFECTGTHPCGLRFVWWIGWGDDPEVLKLLLDFLATKNLKHLYKDGLQSMLLELQRVSLKTISANLHSNQLALAVQNALYNT